MLAQCFIRKSFGQVQTKSNFKIARDCLKVLGPGRICSKVIKVVEDYVCLPELVEMVKRVSVRVNGIGHECLHEWAKLVKPSA